MADEPAAAPLDPLTELVTTATMLFYLAEHEENPGIASYWDAFHYVSTAASVGYANVFPVTPLGKLIGGIVMMVGPSLALKPGG
jgi:voltage-gated potassium channel